MAGSGVIQERLPDPLLLRHTLITLLFTDSGGSIFPLEHEASYVSGLFRGCLFNVPTKPRLHVKTA